MTVQHFIITGFRYVWRYIRKPVFFIYDKFFYVDFTCSLADILQPRHGEFNKELFLVASRVLDIHGFYECNDESFHFQELCHVRKVSDIENEQCRINYLNLIRSVEKDGFWSDSKVFIDKELFLFDGSHRLGLYYFRDEFEFVVRCFFRNDIWGRVVDGHCKLNIPPQMYEDILHECARMQQTFLERGYSFMLWISGNDDEQVRHLIFGLTPFVEVYKTYRIASNTTRYNDGYLVQFTPRNLEYAVTRKGYYAKNVKRMESILSKRIANLGWNQRFAISQNCLEGHTMMETVQAFLKEVV